MTTEAPRPLRNADCIGRLVAAPESGQKSHPCPFAPPQTFPISDLEASLQFLLKLGKYFSELKHQPEIKQALAQLFVDMLLPLAAVCFCFVSTLCCPSCVLQPKTTARCKCARRDRA